MFESISQSVEAYLSDKNDSEKVDRFYKPKIYCFRDYLFNRLYFHDDYSGVQKIKQLDIGYLFGSMEFYVEQSRQSINKQYHVFKIGSLHDYLFVLKDYFEFLNNSKQPNKKVILEIAKWKNDPSLCNEIINDIALKCKLVPKKVIVPFTSDEVSKLLDKCDTTIDDYKEKGVFISKKHQDYKMFTSAIILKLIYYTGIAYRVIKSIKVGDVDLQNSSIRIGKYSIKMPLEFTKQLEIYKRFRNKIPNASENLLFFIPSQRTSSPYNNVFVKSILKHISKTNITGLRKYTITNRYMVKGVPEIVIMDLTDCTRVIIEDCKRYVEYKEDYSFLNRIVNNGGIY